MGTWTTSSSGLVQLCDLASENHFLCLAKYGQFQSDAGVEFAADIA